MSRIVVTDRFLKLQKDLLGTQSPPVETPRQEKKLELRGMLRDNSFLSPKKMTEEGGELPRYLAKKAEKSNRVTIDLGTQKMEFPSIRDAELWSVNKRHEILSPKVFLASDRSVESSIYGLSLLDDVISKRYNRMLYDETKLERLSDLHTRIQAKQESSKKEIEKRIAKRHREQIGEVEKVEKAPALEKNKEVLEILDRKTKFGFRRAKRLQGQHDKLYGPFWSKHSDFAL
eukprot:TRINITY_DN9626_c0_g1_i2.p1 TRINITY_DN9626_c0_g1~~TRINITY_DN9626_c0_g1_i2.p1  ORF type:complete len:231 (-),score=50.34 TRINITY_DN9626_c0_g1_i2:83-775(-)